MSRTCEPDAKVGHEHNNVIAHGGILAGLELLHLDQPIDVQKTKFKYHEMTDHHRDAFLSQLLALKAELQICNENISRSDVTWSDLSQGGVRMRTNGRRKRRPSHALIGGICKVILKTEMHDACILLTHRESPWSKQ